MNTLYLLVKCCESSYLSQTIMSLSTVTIKSSGQEEFVDEMLTVIDLVVIIAKLFIIIFLLKVS